MHHWHKCKGSLKRISLMKFVQDAVHLLIVYTYIIQPNCVLFLWLYRSSIKYLSEMKKRSDFEPYIVHLYTVIVETRCSHE